MSICPFERNTGGLRKRLEEDQKIHEVAEEQAQPMLHMQVPLLQLYLFLSDGCSLSCQRCGMPHASANEKPARFLALQAASQAIAEALPLGLQSVRLSGGQTLQYPHLEALLGQLERQVRNIVLEINGGEVTPALAARLACLPCVSVLVGLDGADALTHDRLHDTPGAFEQATANVRCLSAAGLAAEIVFNVQRANAGQLSAVVGLAETLGAGSIQFVVPQTGVSLPAVAQQQSPANSNRLADELQVPELIALSRKVERELTPRTRLRLSFGVPPAFRGLHPLARIEGQGRCNPLNSLTLLASGQYSLCGMGEQQPEFLLGSSEYHSLTTLWHSAPLLKQLRDGMPDQLRGICEQCIMKSACMGNCAVENSICTGSLWGPYWFCETAAQAGLFPAGRLIQNIW